MTEEQKSGIRWPVKPWGPLNKTGSLENAPPPRTLEQAERDRDMGEFMTGEKSAK